MRTRNNSVFGHFSCSVSWIAIILLLKTLIVSFLKTYLYVFYVCFENSFCTTISESEFANSIYKIPFSRTMKCHENVTRKWMSLRHSCSFFFSQNQSKFCCWHYTSDFCIISSVHQCITYPFSFEHVFPMNAHYAADVSLLKTNLYQTPTLQ